MFQEAMGLRRAEAKGKRSGRIGIVVEEAHPVSLEVSRSSRGSYRWSIRVKASSIEEAEDSAQRLDEWCRSVFMAPSGKAGDVAPPGQPVTINPLPEPAFPIEHKGHVLGSIILGHEKTIIRLDDSCKVRLEDPAISGFLIDRVIKPLCDRLRAKWSPVESDGYLREIVIDKPLSGDDAVSLIKAARWAITKAFSKPLEKKGGKGVSGYHA
jgi:hypothetical protein